MNTVYVNGKMIRLDPAMSKGKGGEADIYLLGNKIALKVYKSPDHPDYALSPHEQHGAEARIQLNQSKLKDFPRNLPKNVVCPIDLATDKSGRTILGFTMDFLSGYELLVRYAEKSFRNAGIDNSQVVSIFKSLHTTVSGIHAAAQIGDFNDLNVMVQDTIIRMIDADSFQFGRYPCNAFTGKFVDPTLCVANPNQSGPILSAPHNEQSDWYAFSVMFMQCLLFLDAGPYGGIYKPALKTKRIHNSDRWQKRITIFDPEVVYPKPATHYKVLPDELLDFWFKLFVKDKRVSLPANLLDLHWTTCSCGTVHARKHCPQCQSMAVGAPTQVTRIEGKVKVTTLFDKKGHILYATIQNGELKYLYHDGQNYRREDQSIVVSGPLDPQMRFRIRNDGTLIGKDGLLLTLSDGKVLERVVVDSYANLPIFDANEFYSYWLQGGKLLRNTPNNPVGFQGQDTIGTVLMGQTLFWTGKTFGFGFYRAGNLSVSFVFDAQQRGINDNVKTPIHGALIDSTCTFSDSLCWFLYTAKVGSRIMNYLHVINRKGTILASVEAEKGSEPWLDNIRGKCAFGSSLFVATDDGLKRLDIQQNLVTLTHEYADTENLVDSGDTLFLGKTGMYVVSGQSVRQLQLR